MKKSLLALFLFALAGVSVLGQSQNPPTLRIVTEDPNLPSELYYGDIKVKPLRLRPGTTQVITINDADFFVQQNYVDFLRRFPDSPGLTYWMGQINECADASKRRTNESEVQCIDRKRVNTSGAFFVSTEFQITGYYHYRMYKGAFGRMPDYATEFVPELKQLTAGIVVNNQLSDDVIEANKQAFATQFAARKAFKDKYDAMDNATYVNTLFTNTGVTASDTDKTALVTGLTNGTETRVSVLRKILDGTRTVNKGNLDFTTTYGKAFYDKEYNAAFVAMQYFGYLRRNPDQAGFDFWLAKLNKYGNFIDAEMVRSFIVSDEYNKRF